MTIERADVSELEVTLAKLREAAEAEQERDRRAIADNPEIVAALMPILHANGVTSVANQGTHGWRCEYPDRYPDPCNCIDALLADLIRVITAEPPEAATDDR